MVKPVLHHHAMYETYATHATACVNYASSCGRAACTTDQVTSEARENIIIEVTSKKSLLKQNAERRDYSTKYFTVSLRINSV